MQHFFNLTPDSILDAVERAMTSGARATGRILTLNSLENRVVDIELDSDEDPDKTDSNEYRDDHDSKYSDGQHVVAKFYRPGRWTEPMLRAEHQFLAELAADEIPVVAPFGLSTGSTIAQTSDGIFFAVFPKMRGRILQELTDLQLIQLGRYLGRIHNIGARQLADPCPRLTLGLNTTVEQSVDRIRAAIANYPLLKDNERLTERFIAAVKTATPAIAGALQQHPFTSIRIHGDCHLGNVLWNEIGPFIIDFDDMVLGPPVQDVWMIVRGRGEEADRQREVLLSGYEQMRVFDHRTLALIEPLRAMRMIHYVGWIASHWEDPTFRHTFPDFGTERYWLEECADLEEQLTRW